MFRAEIGCACTGKQLYVKKVTQVSVFTSLDKNLQSD